MVAAEAGRSNPGRTPVFAPPVAVSRGCIGRVPSAELRPGSPDVVPAEGGPLVFLGGGLLLTGEICICACCCNVHFVVSWQRLDSDELAGNGHLSYPIDLKNVVS